MDPISGELMNAHFHIWVRLQCPFTGTLLQVLVPRNFRLWDILLRLEILDGEPWTSWWLALPNYVFLPAERTLAEIEHFLSAFNYTLFFIKPELVGI